MEPRYTPKPILLTRGGLENQLLVAYLPSQNHSIDGDGVFVMGVQGGHVTIYPHGNDFRFKRSDDIDKSDPLWEIVNEQSAGKALVLNRKPGEYIMAALDFNRDKRRGYDPRNPKSFTIKVSENNPPGQHKLLIFAPDYNVNRNELLDEIAGYYAKIKSATDEQVRAIGRVR